MPAQPIKGATLTVGELIELLRDYDPTLPVAVSSVTSDWPLVYLAHNLDETDVDLCGVQWSEHQATWTIEDEDPHAEDCTGEYKQHAVVVGPRPF